MCIIDQKKKKLLPTNKLFMHKCLFSAYIVEFQKLINKGDKFGQLNNNFNAV